MSLQLKNPPAGSKAHDPSRKVGEALWDQKQKAKMKRKRAQKLAEHQRERGLNVEPEFTKIRLVKKWNRRESGTVLRMRTPKAKHLIAVKVAELVKATRVRRSSSSEDE